MIKVITNFILFFVIVLNITLPSSIYELKDSLEPETSISIGLADSSEDPYDDGTSEEQPIEVEMENFYVSSKICYSILSLSDKHLEQLPTFIPSYVPSMFIPPLS